MTNFKSENISDKSTIISETHRPDGTLATRIVKIDDLNTVLFQYDKNGNIVSSVHKVKISDMFSSGAEKWMTTESKQYHPNGVMSSLITYKQKTVRVPTTDDTINTVIGNHGDEAASYISSITQYNDAGKLQIAAQLNEFDEISFHGDKVACITKRQPDGAHDIMSQTTYHPNGQICTITQYQNNKVVSSITYDENGKPVSGTQQGTDDYQNIFAQTKGTQNKSAKQAFAKASMTLQQAVKILGVSLNATEQEITKAYKKLMLKWHPDRNQGNEEQANRMAQMINEAYAIMKEYVKHRRPENNGNTNHNNRPNGNAADIRLAWQWLQQALREYEVAKSDHELAKKNLIVARDKYHKAKQAAEKERFGSPEREQKMRLVKKLWDVYSQASIHVTQCYNKMRVAEANMKHFEKEYYLLTSMDKAGFSTWTYTHQRNSYQRAA